jgi:hypothetical protein
MLLAGAAGRSSFALGPGLGGGGCGVAGFP